MGVILRHFCSKKRSLNSEASNGSNSRRTASLSQAITFATCLQQRVQLRPMNKLRLDGVCICVCVCVQLGGFRNIIRRPSQILHLNSH
jgi:hypothetical protein